MNYNKIYNELIENRKSNPLTGYTEKHHIKPRSLGGSNDKCNIVKLSAREHFIAHRLLAKIHGGSMWAALSFMSRGGTKSAKGVSISSRAYEYIKKRDAEWRSIAYSGENNYWYGKTIPERMRKKMRGPRPSVTGKNNPNYGVSNKYKNELISFIHRYKPRVVTVDYSLMNRINKSLNIFESVNSRGERKKIKSPAMRELSMYFRAMNLRGDRDLTGEKNPNYGNGQAISGDKNPMYGKEHKASTKVKMAAKAKRRITCPHCGKDGNIANMHRWHLDNCKDLIK